MSPHANIPGLSCLRCGHVWPRRGLRKPKRCAKCATPYWDRPIKYPTISAAQKARVRAPKQQHCEWCKKPLGAFSKLRNSPVTAVTSVTIDGVVIPQSTDCVTPGWVLDQSGKSVALIGSFREGIQNVLVVYSAGYNGQNCPATLALARSGPSVGRKTDLLLCEECSA